MSVPTAVPNPYPLALERHPRLRQSLLATYDACPLSARFHLDYGDGWTSHAAARGRVFHRVAASCLEQMARMGEDTIPVDAALAILDEEVRQAAVDRECPRCFREDPTGLGGGRFECPECGKAWTTDMVALPLAEIAQLRITVLTWATNNAFAIDNLASVEERLRADVTYPSERGAVTRTLTGQLDALFFEPGDTAVVVDWKDTWALPPETEVSFQGYFQQRFYAYLVLTNYPSVERVVLREFYVRRSIEREGSVYRGDLEDVRAELSALAERFDRSVQEDLWRPSPGKHCSYCPRPTACPIFPDARDEGAIESEDMARRYAAEAAVAKAALDRRTRQLKAWANVNGDVPLADAKGRRAWGYVERKTTVKPTREEVVMAVSQGIHPATLFRTRTGTRFEQHVPAEDVNPTPEDARLAEELRASLELTQKGGGNDG